jgi:histidyl-tRNA synthetase
MVDEKGLDGAIADRIGEWVVLRGKEDLLEQIRTDERLSANKTMQEGIADLDVLFKYLRAFDAMDGVSFDLSLARGL